MLSDSNSRASKYYKEFNDLGVRFIYPNNWFVQAQTWDKGVHSISVDSPDGSFWSLAIYPKGIDLDSAAKQIVETMQTEYDEMERSEIKRYVADRILTGYEINFFYLDMTSTATALKFEDERRAYVIFYQTCDRLALTDEDLSRVDIFDAMTHTLVSNLTDQEIEFWDDDDDDFQFGSRIDEKALREEENREFFRRKYERARLAMEEEELRSRVDDFDDEDDEEALKGFLRVVEDDYSANDGSKRDELDDEEAEDRAYDEYGRVSRDPDLDEFSFAEDDEEDEEYDVDDEEEDEVDEDIDEIDDSESDVRER